MELKDQIVALYERDRQLAPRARTRADIPVDYDAITEDWLTAILCKSHPGAAVASFSLAARDDGTANRRRIHIRYNEAGESADLPASVFCKASHDLLHRLTLGITGGAHSEVKFYHNVRPLIEAEVPHAYFSAYDPASFCSIIVLEDIGERVDFCGHDALIARVEASDQVRLLSQLHGRFYEFADDMPHKLELNSWPDFFANVVTLGQEAATNKGFLAAGDKIPARLRARYDEIWPATVASVEHHHRLPRTVVHGDCHLKQWYVTADGRMGLTDWQCATIGNWARDLSYALATSLTIENRRAWERDLLGEYLDLMGGQGVPVPSFDEAWLLYRQNMMSALNWWTGTLTPAPDMPEMQPQETSLIFIERLAHAADDLDSVDACLPA